MCGDYRNFTRFDGNCNRAVAWAAGYFELSLQQYENASLKMVSTNIGLFGFSEDGLSEP